VVVGTRQQRMTEELFDKILLNIMNKTRRHHIYKEIVQHGITTGFKKTGISFQLAFSTGANHVDDDGNVIKYNKKLTMFKVPLISLFTLLVHQFDNKDGTDITDDDTLLMTQNDFNLHQIRAQRPGTSTFGNDTPSTSGMMSPMVRGNGRTTSNHPIAWLKHKVQPQLN
jgi:hypothetical protein